jgi:hypothetical protein
MGVAVRGGYQARGRSDVARTQERSQYSVSQRKSSPSVVGSQSIKVVPPSVSTAAEFKMVYGSSYA